MGQRRHHYEQAFEHHLRQRKVPYVSVNEARKALMPDNAKMAVDGESRSLKSFDFVLYSSETNLLAEVKGRRIGRGLSGNGSGSRRSRLECWVTREDVECLLTWERLFGSGFRAVFVFVYWCDEQPGSALFEEMFEFRGRWYALRAIAVEDYAREMRTRSPRWRTVHLPMATFDQLSRPLIGAEVAAEA